MYSEYLSMADIEAMSNEHVGAACKALLMTWLITADELREGEQPSKIELGIKWLLGSQALGQDTELVMHQIGFCDHEPGDQHDRDQPDMQDHLLTIAAGNEINRLVAYIVHHLSQSGVSL